MMGAVAGDTPEEQQAVQEGQDYLRQQIESMPQSQSRPAQYVNAVAEVAANPVSWIAPLSALGKTVAYNVASGIGGEFMRQRFEGTPYEKFARMAGGSLPIAIERGSQPPGSARWWSKL